MTPDPLPWLDWQNGSERARRRFVGYINNPQNLNMYAYVRNNPTKLSYSAVNGFGGQVSGTPTELSLFPTKS